MATEPKSKKQIGIYVSALTRLTRKPMCKPDYATYQKCLLFNTLSFSYKKKNKYRYVCFCQPLATKFIGFPKASTLVNVCQRIIFNASN